jgi:hypothetical protein
MGMIIRFVKDLWPSFFIWFVIVWSDRISGRPLKRIDNKIIYYFTWLWHFGNCASVTTIMYGIGIQINLIMFSIFSVIPLRVDDLSVRPLYYMTYLEIVLSGIMVGIIEASMTEPRKLLKIPLYILFVMLVGMIIYAGRFYLVIFKYFPVICIAVIIMIVSLLTYGFYNIFKS